MAHAGVFLRQAKFLNARSRNQIPISVCEKWCDLEVARTSCAWFNGGTPRPLFKLHHYPVCGSRFETILALR